VSLRGEWTLYWRDRNARWHRYELIEPSADIVEALVGDEGVDPATTRGIAERAGVTAPSLYRFFADRHKILDTLARRGHAAEPRCPGGDG
jgi:hypothetical protein